jgi:hypothetical protein
MGSVHPDLMNAPDSAVVRGRKESLGKKLGVFRESRCIAAGSREIPWLAGSCLCTELDAVVGSS